MSLLWLILFLIGMLILAGLVKHAQGLGASRGMAFAMILLPFVMFLVGFFCFMAVSVGATPPGG